jgi:hypothetical protein
VRAGDPANTEFSELETQLRGALVTVKDAQRSQEFERRKEQVFDELWEHIVAGRGPAGLLPEIRNLSHFLDTR